MFTGNSSELLSNWKKEIDEFTELSKTFCLAVYSIKGKLLHCNSAFKSLIGDDEIGSLINPTFTKLTELKSDKKIIFEGFLTIGNIAKNKSILSKIYRNDKEIFIIGEFEIEQIMQLNAAMIDLNREINNLQRQLIKEKTALSDTNKKLNRLNEEKNKILGITTHDVRNPIGTALGYADMLSKRFTKISNEDIQKFLLVIVDSCQFSLGLLNNLLDISKIESGKVQLNLKDVNYVKLVSDIIERNQILATQKYILIKVSSKVKSPKITIDSQKIEQVLNNLLSNAIKYSNSHTEIQVTISQANDTLKTEVIDQGQGIPAKEIPNLFAPFQTTSIQSTAGEKSTGLGLAIVKKIIAEHGGEIFIKSKPGKGSNFYFNLPIVKP